MSSLPEICVTTWPSEPIANSAKLFLSSGSVYTIFAISPSELNTNDFVKSSKALLVIKLTEPSFLFLFIIDREASA